MKIIILYWRCLMAILLFFINLLSKIFYIRIKNSNITINQRHDFYENNYLFEFYE